MKKPLRLALMLVILALTVLLLVFDIFDDKLWPGKWEPLCACIWALLALEITITFWDGKQRAAKFVCAGAACAVLTAGAIALFLTLPAWAEIAIDAAAAFALVAACIVNLLVIQKSAGQGGQPLDGGM